MSKDKLDILKQGFQSECKVINLQYEYEGYRGKEQWAVISELSEEKILERYKPFVQEYIPFLVLPVFVRSATALTVSKQSLVVHNELRGIIHFLRRYVGI